MKAFIETHTPALVATAGILFGMLGGGHALYELAQYEQHHPTSQGAR